ncbi:MAG: energy transducer TonB [Piscinibacter sp.]|uniref:energy transducer TonB n=1 Tax=Piscinibacter sp. TaxID=1903157 RepID=UPI003D0E28B3
MPFASRQDEIPPAQRRAAVATILALHVAAAWGLLQVDAVRSAVVEAAPLFVELIAPPVPERPPEPPAPPPPSLTPKPPPPPAPVIAAAPRIEAPAAFVVPESPPEPAPPAPPEPPVVVVAAPAPPAPPPPPAAPRELPASAIQYLEPPEPVYPRASRRLGEAGLVVVRVFVGADGLPKQLQVLHSSGFLRLDEAALEGVRRARFMPPTENGRPTAGWARIPIPFELEK